MSYRPLPREAQRLTVYFGEADRWQGKPLYLAMLETLKAHGLAGATVTRGVAGFGAHSRIHTATILRLSEDLPLRLEVIDTPERIRQAVDLLRPMLREGLMVVEPVQVLFYAHRGWHPLPADAPVRQVMTPDPVAAHPDWPVRQALRVMFAHDLKALPVVDAQQQVLGVFTASDVLAPLSLTRRLTPEELTRHLGDLAQRPVAEFMSRPPILARADEPLGYAVQRMVQHGLKRLPVVDDRDRLVGVLSRVDVLRTVQGLPGGISAAGPVPQEAGQTLGDLLTPDFPHVAPEDDLATVVEVMLCHNARRVVVLDAQGHPLGLITDADLLARVAAPQRAGLLAALLRRRPPAPTQLTAAQVMSTGVLTASPDTPLTEALQRLLQTNRKWLVVTDPQGRALGVVDRQQTLAALLPSMASA